MRRHVHHRPAESRFRSRPARRACGPVTRRSSCGDRRHAAPVDPRTVLVFSDDRRRCRSPRRRAAGPSIEAPRRPRVIQTSPLIARQQATGDLIPVAPAAMILGSFVRHSANDHLPDAGTASSFDLSLRQDVLTIWPGRKELDAVDLRGLDTVTGAFGAIATLDDRAWLAILVRLRATGRRQLLLIFDPAATLVHQRASSAKRTGWIGATIRGR